MNTAIVSMTPKLVVSDADAALAFYTAAFGAAETERYTMPDGTIVYASMRIGDSVVAVKDEGHGDLAPTSAGGGPSIITLDVTDPDAVTSAASAAGATVVYPIADQAYGARAGRLADPFGHLWIVSAPLEDLSAAEIQRRVATMSD